MEFNKEKMENEKLILNKELNLLNKEKKAGK
jgi:hypothetical protein